MDSDNIKKELEDLLELINEQTEMIYKQKGEIPQLYLDMLKENTLKFYEKIHLLDKQKNIKNPEPDQKKVRNKDVKPKPEEKPKEIIENKKEEKPKTELIQEPVISIVEEKVEEIAIEPELKMKPKIEENPASEKKDTSPLVIDMKPAAKDEPTPAFTFEDPLDVNNKTLEPAPTIGDKLKDKQDPSLVDKIQQKEIADIKKEIGINDKFLMINELFEGDMKGYNEVIDQLNTRENQSNAINTLNTLIEKHNWDHENEAFLKLKDFVERRYK